MAISLYTLANINYISRTMWESCQMMLGNLNHEINWLFRSETIYMAVPMMIGVVVVTIMIMTIWVYYISNRIVGPYQRIVNDLDKMAEGKKRKLTVRDGDEMFSEIITRFNKLLDE